MPREDVLSALLGKDIDYNPNILLLKKFILTVHYGWFRVNGLSPDVTFTLGDYLLDNERVIIDFTRMSEQAREKFLDWFLVPHRGDAHMELLSGVATNNYRGYTAEVGLSWWGRITNLIYYRKKSYHWHLAQFELSLNYQLTGLEICQDSHGLLIGLNQFSIEDNKGAKYREPDDNQTEPLRNTKRVLLTDEMVSKLVTCDLNSQDFNSMIYNPHPFAIDVVSYGKRMLDMREYRFTQRLLSTKSWYVRLFDWIKHWFVTPEQKIELEEMHFGSKKYQLLFEDNGVRVFKRENDSQIFVTEKRPELDSVVYCGGGAKIFAHVGAKKAFEEAHIELNKFAGSSAGGIMAILSYLGCSSADILRFFQTLKQDNLIHYDIDSSGLSDAQAMKAALDYMITKKVNEIIRKYSIDKTPEGRRFLADSVFKRGKITFESLHLLKKRYPDCSLGEKLILTATNVERRKTRYFSYETTPWMEPSKAGQASACLPVIFKPTLVEGTPHKDGGILSNLPTEVFKGDLSTLLESEHGNCLSLVAFQFDHGYERSLLDKLAERVYRENFVWNWIYGFLTGVKDPVSGWEQDRLKLLQHSNQVVLIPVGNISTTQFDIEPDMQNILVENGYQAAKNYIAPRFCSSGTGKNAELMYSTFASFEELLYFCCYRGHLDWFNKIAPEAMRNGMSEQKIQKLRELYFTSSSAESNDECDAVDDTSEPTVSDVNFPLRLSGSISEKQWIIRNMQLFEAIYPIFHKLSASFFTIGQDLKLFKIARHSLNLNHPLAGLRYLREIKGEVHVLLYIFIQLLQNAHRANIEDVLDKFSLLATALQRGEKLKQPSFFGKWDLLPRQCTRVLNLMNNQNWEEAIELCTSLKQGEEPLQTFRIVDDPIQGVEDDNANNWGIEGNRACFSL
ncbi:esterase of the alpha-beta hydrolase superfamily [Legionella lansingensis]|uniref:Esterase of the alpha-beta hydrolase superfamily protein n=1 Tax=Legionella lansingensis TaxID=45067 RepID=A0A0W0VS67_9GAMM|nr:Dot/Icm T4SS effector VpdC [Legionella lansingensis]KTD22797.1 esterase of the alpha-beta hydrolase superfamily protein [Legionella lansingensis]SNV49785.1 esterase of the alpha-beta hydrolase superfamily [Legionella lansingensis]